MPAEREDGTVATEFGGGGSSDAQPPAMPVNAACRLPPIRLVLVKTGNIWASKPAFDTVWYEIFDCWTVFQQLSLDIIVICF